MTDVLVKKYPTEDQAQELLEVLELLVNKAPRFCGTKKYQEALDNAGKLLILVKGKQNGRQSVCFENRLEAIVTSHPIEDHAGELREALKMAFAELTRLADVTCDEDQESISKVNYEILAVLKKCE